MGGMIHFRTLEDLRLQGLRSHEHLIEFGGLEPKEDAVPARLRFGLAQMGMFVCVPVMKLKDEAVPVDESLVLGTAVTAPASEERLVPAAADLARCEQR